MKRFFVVVLAVLAVQAFSEQRYDREVVFYDTLKMTTLEIDSLDINGHRWEPKITFNVYGLKIPVSSYERRIINVPSETYLNPSYLYVTATDSAWNESVPSRDTVKVSFIPVPVVPPVVPGDTVYRSIPAYFTRDDLSAGIVERVNGGAKGNIILDKKSPYAIQGGVTFWPVPGALCALSFSFYVASPQDVTLDLVGRNPYGETATANVSVNGVARDVALSGWLDPGEWRTYSAGTFRLKQGLNTVIIGAMVANQGIVINSFSLIPKDADRTPPASPSFKIFIK